MKVGILTFHRAVNYGAVLQAYALQKTIEKMGFDAEVIDYICPKIHSDYLPDFSSKKLMNLVKQCMSAPYLLLRRKSFYSFLKANLKMSEPYSSVDEFKTRYDAIIVGSDQVWQYNLTGNDEAYFLKDIEDIKKISYAASFSLRNNRINENQLKLLEDFNSISVRERPLAEWLEKRLNKRVYTVCDPTLLLQSEAWEELLCSRQESKKTGEEYILAFNVLKTNGMLEFAEKLAAKHNKKLIVLTTSVIKKVKGKYIRTANPAEFISLFKDAYMIVTNSFHGTAFSVIFEKNFYVETVADKGIVNERIIDLLRELGIKNRSLDEYKEDSSIDYIEVRRHKRQIIDRAMEYLNMNLN